MDRLEQFKILFECHNQPDTMLTQEGIDYKHKLHDLIRELNDKIGRGYHG